MTILLEKKRAPENPRPRYAPLINEARESLSTPERLADAYEISVPEVKAILAQHRAAAL